MFDVKFSKPILKALWMLVVSTASTIIGIVLIDDPGQIANFGFYIGVLILLFLCTCGVGILVLCLGYFYAKKDFGMVTFMWFLIPLSELGVLSGVASNWKGYQTSDWIPIFIVTFIWQVIIYFWIIWRERNSKHY